MKRTVILFLLSSSQALAEPLTCPQMSEMAEKVMEARQSGVPMAKMMEISESNGLGEPEINFMQGAIAMAYEETAWRTEEAQRRAVTEFGNGIMLACVKSH